MTNKIELCIGIDLYGALIKDNIDPKLVSQLNKSIELAKNNNKICLCSNLPFNMLSQTLPDSVLEKFDSFVCETGCSIINKGESILPESEDIQKIKELAKKLKETEFNNFILGKASITYITDNPIDDRDMIEEEVDMLRFFDFVDILSSQNGVHIIPKGFNKYIGLKLCSEGKFIACITEQDIPLINYSDFAYLLANSPSQLEDLLRKNLATLQPILLKDMVQVPSKEYTEGVIEILDNFQKIFISNSQE